MNGERIRIRAEDAADLEVFGAVLQDAIVPLADMLYLRDESRFHMVVNRFMWERPGEPLPAEEGEAGEAWMRVHGLLSVAAVRNVRLRGIDRNDRDRLLCLLAVAWREGAIDLEFAGGGTVRIEVARIDCRFEDLGDPWPTRWRPCHIEPE